jgi:O-methyltransferase domain
MTATSTTPSSISTRFVPPPHESLWALTTAFVPCSCLHVVAELGVADYIADDPVAVEELAASCGADPIALDRILRLLETHGIFRRLPHGSYCHTDASRLLRSDHPKSMRAFTRFMGLPVMWNVFSNLDHSARTGRPAIELIEPTGFMRYLGEHPDDAVVFNHAMTAKAAADIAAIVDAHEFSAYGRIADIGGGRGHLLHAVLDAVPETDGVLFDLPEVIATLEMEHPRLQTAAGDFFAVPLPAADAYVLMEILHGWSDEDCIRILTAVRRAANPDAKVLIIESILAEDRHDPRGHTLDVIMLAVPGGRERTPTELARLLEASGFRYAGVTDTSGSMRIVEAAATS